MLRRRLVAVGRIGLSAAALVIIVRRVHPSKLDLDWSGDRVAWLVAAMVVTFAGVARALGVDELAVFTRQLLKQSK